MRARQLVILLVGVVLAAVMGVAGVWQMDVYRNKGQAEVVARAQQPPVPLEPLIKTDQSAFEAYGLQVRVRGQYLPDQQFYIGDQTPLRVLSPFRTDTGRTLAIVRGTVLPGQTLPAPPSGEVEQVGVFLPGEGSTGPGTGSGQGLADPRMPAVQLGLLAQRWPAPMVSGFVTLTREQSAAQGLGAAPVALPEGRGSAQNLSYAMQWWAFGSFALVMAVVLARSQRRAAAGVTSG